MTVHVSNSVGMVRFCFHENNFISFVPKGATQIKVTRKRSPAYVDYFPFQHPIMNWKHEFSLCWGFIRSPSSRSIESVGR